MPQALADAARLGLHAHRCAWVLLNFGPPLLGQGTGSRRPGRGMGWYRHGNSATRKDCRSGGSLLGPMRWHTPGTMCLHLLRVIVLLSFHCSAGFAGAPFRLGLLRPPPLRGGSVPKALALRFIVFYRPCIRVNCVCEGSKFSDSHFPPSNGPLRQQHETPRNRLGTSQLRLGLITQPIICIYKCTLCYAIMLPGRKSAFRVRFWPDCYRENTEIDSPAGRRADFGTFPVAVQPKSGPEG